MSDDLDEVDALLDGEQDGVLDRVAEYAMDWIDELDRGSDRGYARGVVRGYDLFGAAGSLLNTAKDAVSDTYHAEDLDDVPSGADYVAAKDSTDYSSLSGKVVARQREDDDEASRGAYLLGAAVGAASPAIGAAVNNDPSFLGLYAAPAAYGGLNTLEREARRYLEQE